MAEPVPILVLLGPTASGKTDLALALAARVGAEILSLDSMQVYREMNIGTAKPDRATLARVRHHGVDVADPADVYTVARFVELADQAIDDAARRGVPLIATGGTPLYYKAVFEGLFDGPGEDAELRSRLRAEPPERLHARLLAIDPKAAGRIHPNDTKRLVRAMEVYELTGVPISRQQGEWGEGHTRHPAVWVGLLWDKDALNRRINARVRAMLEAGWLEEARRLAQRPGGLSRTASEATGYRQLLDHLAGRMSLADAAEQIKIATRQLARKQMKWFRRFPGVHWLPGDAPLDDNAAAAMALWGVAER